MFSCSLNAEIKKKLKKENKDSKNKLLPNHMKLKINIHNKFQIIYL